jgi:hypothetical protein
MPGEYLEMDNIWRSTQYSTNTKLKLYQSGVVSNLIYGLECWRIIETILSKLRSFHLTCLCRILMILWPVEITNEDLINICKQDMGVIVTKRRWRWTGHVLRKHSKSIKRTALHWTQEGKRKRDQEYHGEGQLRARKVMQQTWESLMKLARDRQEWRKLVAALYTTMCKGR